ncbi:MAG: hypothetical protein HOP11_01995 [Saprospiraceae bacterium]|nr:hypothetical protein [Saprospiraceae bacterium]
MNKSIPSEELLSSLNSLLYLYDIQDPGNFGTLLRTADWFGHKVILCSSNCVDPYNNKSVQASMSSLSRIMIFTIEADEIRKKFPNFRIIATCMNGQDYGSVNFTEKSIFCLGNEAHGLPAEFISASDIAITIKGNSLGAESLNVSIAGGIILSHLNSQS